MKIVKITVCLKVEFYGSSRLELQRFIICFIYSAVTKQRIDVKAKMPSKIIELNVSPLKTKIL